WPGNVRELCNVIKVASFFANDIIEPVHLNKVLSSDKENKINSFDLDSNIENIEKNLIKSALEKTNYNKNKAAKILGITRKTLYKKLEKYKLLEKET
ncbi:MAG: helix-turn-helix domain-containing protein, partial [Endomicrobiia bacterium]